MTKPINRLDTDNPQGYFRVLFISDIHSGSNVSVKHPDISVCSGSEGEQRKITNNKIQNILYKEWEHMAERIGHIDRVVFLGDSCDGSNYKSEGMGTWTTDLDEQLYNAVKLGKMIDADKWIGVQGSGYHVNKNKSLDQCFIEEMNGSFREDRGQDFDIDIRLEIEELRFNLRHWLSTTRSTFMYQPTKIAREMLKIMQSKKDLGEYDFVVRGHVHTELYLDMISSTGMCGITLPCWKARDDLVKGFISSSADMGWYLFDVDGEHFTRYNRPVHIPVKYNIKTLKVGRNNE